MVGLTVVIGLAGVNVAQVQDLNPQEKRSAESGARDAAQLGGAAHDAAAARSQHAALRRRANELVCVHYGGRQFIATYEMAGIFLRRAQRLLDANESELVPLLHAGGLELLYVAPSMPFAVHDANAEPADGSHPSLPRSGPRSIG